MPAEILLAPVGAGKTEAALERLAQTLNQQSFARIWVLVSGKRQEDSFRQRLAERADGRRVYFNVEFFTFYQLYHRLLNIAQQPPRMLDDTARFGLLRSILIELQQAGHFRVFNAIATMPGFVRIMAEFTYELKQNLIYPNDFSAVARSQKDRELALIYSTYQERLQEHVLVDREGDGWLALETIKKPAYEAIGRDVDLLLVDGYDHFSPLQASLLMLVADRAQEALITLATVPGRSDTVGRRFAEALEQLQAYSPAPPRIIFDEADIGNQHRPAALRHVIDSVFQQDARPGSAGNHIQFVEAPEPVQESAAVMRHVKRLLLRDNTAPDDILIALRDWQRYAGHLAASGRAYGVPMALHLGEPLNENPTIIMLLNLLGLHENDFRRRDLLDVLRSPYFHVPGIGREKAEQLELISQRLLITGGRASWLEAVRRAGQSHPGDDEEWIEADDRLLDSAQIDALSRDLSRFFRAVTPPEKATLGQYVHWLDNLIGPDMIHDPDDDDSDMAIGEQAKGLGMPAQLRQESALGIEARDRAALEELKRVLRSLLAAETLLSTFTPDRQITRDLFLLELRTAVDNTAIHRSPTRNGKVLVTTVADARGLPHRHVFIPGLSEGIFPAPQPEDRLYLDSEREVLAKYGVRLETQAERSADDGLFYELIGLARETLSLSRPTVQDGAPWPPSHLWRAVTDVLSDAPAVTQRVAPGEVVSAENVASADEALLAVADGLNNTPPSAVVSGLYNWVLQTDAVRWTRINHVRWIELRRMARGLAHDRYTGRLTTPAMIDYAAAQLGPGRLWSASQLNDYGVCGFRFFAKRLLKLEAWEEPEESLDAAKLGTINHAILEGTYHQIGQRGLAIAPENVDTALAVMQDVAHRLLENAPAQLGFADDALWVQEKGVLLRRLEALIRKDFSAQSPVSKRIPGKRYPYLQEAPFGIDGGMAVSIPIEVDGQTEALRVRGYIDRMDRVGDEIFLVDYKSGTTRIPVADMRDGRNFQMMVYLRAAEQLLAAQDPAAQVAGGLFWHIRDQTSSGELLLDADGEEALQEAEKHIGRYIAAGRKGDFTVQPRKIDRGRCVHYCEFSQLCRTASTNRQKGNV